MMKTTLLTLAACVYSIFAFGQCNNLTYTTQAQVDAIPVCATVTGTLTLSGIGITNLAALSNITSITGILTINNTGLTNLSGLENLTSAQAVNISNNTLLTDINALNKTIVSTLLNIFNNAALDQCCAFKSQISSLGNVTISNNATKAGGGCNSAMEITADTSCDIAPAAAVPTLGEWGLICLGLMMMIVGVVTLRQKEIQGQFQIV